MAADVRKYSVKFLDQDHESFYLEALARAEADGKRLDGYFLPMAYLCGLTAETRTHFGDLFDWGDWGIRHESLSAGWQTGTSLRVTRLAFNLWNGCGSDDPDGCGVQEEYLPDSLFENPFTEYFFEAVRLRFPRIVP